MSAWTAEKLIYAFATGLIDPMVRKAFKAIQFWLDGFIDVFNDLGDAFDVHWPRHEFGGDDEGTAESLATEGEEGQIIRGAGGRELEVTDRLTVGDADQTLTGLLGNTAVDGGAIHDGLLVVKRTAAKFERAYTELLLNGDMEDDNAGVPRHWTEVVVTPGITSVQNSNMAYVFKGAHSWCLYMDSPM